MGFFCFPLKEKKAGKGKIADLEAEGDVASIVCRHRGCGQVPSALPTQLWKCSSALICSSRRSCPGLPHSPGSCWVFRSLPQRSGSGTPGIFPPSTSMGHPRGAIPTPQLEAEREGGKNVHDFHKSLFNGELLLLRSHWSQAAPKRKPHQTLVWGCDTESQPRGCSRNSQFADSPSLPGLF